MALQVNNPRAKKVAGGIGAAMAAAMVFLIPFLKDHEGLSLKAYLDVAKVWTVCYGRAYVDPKTTYTQKQCDALLESDAAVYMRAVYGAMKYEPHPFVLASHTSFAYNIGIAGYKRSSALALTNAGKPLEGCKAMMNWHTSGGKDCRLKSSNCPGLITRREDEINMCTAGAL